MAQAPLAGLNQGLFFTHQRDSRATRSRHLTHHTAVDDRTRLAYSEIRPDETGPTAPTSGSVPGA